MPVGKQDNSQSLIDFLDLNCWSKYVTTRIYYDAEWESTLYTGQKFLLRRIVTSYWIWI